MLKRLQRFTRGIWRRMPQSLRILTVRVTQAKFTVSATAIIVNSHNEVLLLDHVLRPFSSWALPGGFLASHESAEQALRREIVEEIGLEMENVKIVYANTVRRHIEIFFYANPVGEPAVASREILGFKWFKAEDLPPNISRIQRELIDRVFKAGV